MEKLSNDSKEILSDFPDEIFSQEQRLQGGVIIYVLASIYCCYALSAVCDSYFIPALHLMVKKLGLSNDVAGASLMATASAAPGFFISIIGTFVIHNDLGLGNIIGSCVFNLYAVIGVCGLLITQDINMEWWPVTRDCAYYVFSLIILAVTLYDKKMYWYDYISSSYLDNYKPNNMPYKGFSFLTLYESIILLTAYAFYLVVLKYSKQIKCNLEQLNMCLPQCLRIKTENYAVTEDLKNEQQTVVVVISNEQPTEKHIEANTDCSLTKKTEEKKTEVPSDEKGNTSCIDCHDLQSVSEKEPSILNMPSSLAKRVVWFITLPIKALLWITLPNCKKAKWERFYIMTFVISILYIGSITYIVSWMVSVIGVTFCIKDTIMGYTALAIGTSMPDLFCSITVARQGYGNMAIANGIGSNIMDILINLSVPWFIKSVLPSSKGFASIPDRNISYIILTMIVSVCPIYVVLLRYHFNLNRKVAGIALGLYLIFMVVSVLLSVL